MNDSDKRIIVLKKEELILNENVWDSPYFAECVYVYYKYNISNNRGAIASTKTRGEVKGSSRKIRPQKHTGMARAGSIRAPHFRGGGVAFGPRSNRNFKISINKKEIGKALSSIISRKLLENNIFFIDTVPNISDYSSRLALNIIDGMKIPIKGNEKMLIICSPEEIKNSNKFRYSLSNIRYVKFSNSISLNAMNLLNVKYLVFTRNSITSLESRIIRKGNI